MKYTILYLKYVFIILLSLTMVLFWCGMVLFTLGGLFSGNPELLILVPIGLIMGLIGFVVFDFFRFLVDKWGLDK